MNQSIFRWARQAGLALVLTTGVFTTAAAAPAPRLDHVPDVRITEADVAESNAEIRDAYAALAGMWAKDFEAMGRRFAVPRIYSYRGNVRTSCGVMMANNAAYCPARNAIYFDEVFLTRQRKEAARHLGTDGDMAGIGVIAHEMGHAAAIQLGIASRITYENEAIADCLAGAFARRAQEDGSLEPGDLDEAMLGLAAAGDPEVELTGNARIDNRRLARARMMGHGTSEQRVSNFETGLERGIRGCLPR
ncbi:MAG TPA: neutral zinc metallopeptidase [Gemmatimonadaceae bacterium]|nr:neutral zinc metallopeptidase [Gemmatimonadaceae bacterium]